MFKNKKSMGIPAGLALGLLASLIITLSGAGIGAWLIADEIIGEESAAVTAAITQLLSAAMGAVIARLCVGKLRLQVCMLSGSVYYLMLMGITALFFEGSYQGLLLTALMVLIGCSIAAFFPGKKSQSSHRRKRAYR